MLEDWEEDDDDVKSERDRVTWRSVLLVTLRGLMGAGAAALVTLEALGAFLALEELVMALGRDFALDLEPLEGWEGAAAVLDRVSIVDVYRLSESVYDYLIV